jgi:hypothetical protein
MKKKITYKDVPLGKIKIVKSFLPKPEDLIFKEDVVEVKVPFDRRSIEFFKKQARKQHVEYEQIIRALVDNYAAHYGA